MILMIDMYIETLINLDIHMATDAEFDIRLHRRVVDHLKWSAKAEKLELHLAENAGPGGSKCKVAKIKGNGLKVGCLRDGKGAR